MIFPKEHLPLILGGAITRTRRPLDPNKPRQYRKGDFHTIKRSGGQSLGKLQIVRAWVESLDLVTDGDARAEGYPDLETYLHEWTNTHQASWTDSEAWVIEFRMDSSEPIRLLASHHGRKFTGDYTSSNITALPDEPEAVDAEWQERFTRRAHDAEEAVKRDLAMEQSAKSLSQRLEEIKAEAAARGIDIRRQELSLERRIVAIESKVRKRAA